MISPSSFTYGQSRRNAFVFLIFALAGGSAIFFLKSYIDDLDEFEWFRQRKTETVIVFPMVLMTLYALLAYLPGLRLRQDQIGDNLYYLGFIYTLCSLSVALGSVASGEEVDREILRAFGIAITSTLWGITLRVFFNQMKVDPYDAERASRLELSEATKRVRRELDDTVVQLEDFRRNAVQAMSKGFEETQKSVEEISQRVLSSLEEISTEGGNSIKRAEFELTTALGNTCSIVRDFSIQAESLRGTHLALAEASKDATDAFATISIMQKDAAETDRVLREELTALTKEMKKSLQFQRTTADDSLADIRRLGGMLREYLEISRQSGDWTQAGLEKLLSEVGHSTKRQSSELSNLLLELIASANEERNLRSDLQQFITELKERLDTQGNNIETSLSDIRSLRNDVKKTLQQTRNANAEIEASLRELNGIASSRFDKLTRRVSDIVGRLNQGETGNILQGENEQSSVKKTQRVGILRTLRNFTRKWKRRR